MLVIELVIVLVIALVIALAIVSVIVLVIALAIAPARTKIEYTSRRECQPDEIGFTIVASRQSKLDSQDSMRSPLW